MKDRIRISAGLLACFCTNLDYGMLDVVSGRVALNKTKIFNTARLLLDSGANTIRILRHAPWANPVRFDYDCDSFWPLMREYVQILHQPTQNEIEPEGADVWLEIFDGCGQVKDTNQTTLDKEWMYADYAKARKVIAEAFKYLGDLPYVKFGCGNEMNQAATVEFHKKALFPAFKLGGRVPFSYGPIYSDVDDFLEVVKKDAENYWADRDKLIFRQIHAIRDSTSPHFLWFTENWMKHPIRVSLSGDGVKPRPSGREVQSILQYLFDYAPVEFPNPADTKLKFIVERMGGENAEAAITAVSKVYHQRFGAYPQNFGQYPKDWVDPEPPPEPPEPPAPPPPPPPDQSCYEKYIKDRPIGKWQVGAYIKCIFGK